MGGFVIPVVLAVLASASGTPVNIEVLSFGSNSCGQFVQADTGEQRMYLAWTLGYITGHNESATTTAGRLVGIGWDQDSFTVWMKQYCLAHPLDLYVEASAKYRNALAAQEGIAH